MNMENYQSELIDAFYGESNFTVAEIAEKYGLPLDKCQKDWDLMEAISQRFKRLPEYEPSPFSLNKINEQVLKKFSQPLASKKSFWNLLWQPAFSLATFALVGFLVFFMAQKSDMFGAKKGGSVAVSKDSKQVDRMNQRLFSTPLDNYPQKNRVFSNVSLGNSEETYRFDDDLETQFLSKNPTSRELELLFFRARKLEKLEYYQEALNDYQLIERFTTDAHYQRAVPLAMARCYEKLGQKNQAISILEKYEDLFGLNDDIKIWMDQLKSETF